MVDIFLLLDIILVLTVIALAISLLIMVPQELQRKAALALREKTWNSRTSNGRDEDGQASAIPMSCDRSGSHPSTDGPKSIKG